MAKEQGLSLEELLKSQEKSNLKVSSIVQEQLLSLQRQEVISKQDLNILRTQQNDKTSSDNSAKLIEEVKKSNKTLELGLNGKSGEGLNANIIKMGKALKESQTIMTINTKEVLDRSRQKKEFKSIGQTISGVKDSAKDLFSMRGFLDKTGIAKRESGGVISNMLDAKEARQKQAQARVASGERAREPESGKVVSAKQSEKMFESDAKKEQALRRKQGDLERSISNKFEGNISDKQISQTKESKELQKVSEAIAKLNPQFNSESIQTTEQNAPAERVSRTQESNDEINVSEEEMESIKIQTDQTDLLTKIEENTRGSTASSSEASSNESGGGGLLAGIGKGLQGLGKGLSGLGKGIGAAIKSVLFGLAQGLTALGTAFANPLVTVALAGVTLAIMGIGKALQFAAPAIEAFVPVLVKLVETIGTIFTTGLEKLPEIIKAVGDVITAIGDNIVKIIDAVVTSVERLANIDGTNLLSVGAGLVAVSAGLATFAAANVLAGVSNIATGLMSAVSGQKTPVEQLEQIAKFGPNLDKAGTGVQNLAKGLADFSSIDADKIKSLAALPTEKIAAMGAAMGNANKVYEKSSDNKQASESKKGKESNTVVSAPTTTINKTTQASYFRSNPRSSEASINSYYKSRYV